MECSRGRQLHGGRSGIMRCCMYGFVVMNTKQFASKNTYILTEDNLWRLAFLGIVLCSGAGAVIAWGPIIAFAVTTAGGLLYVGLQTVEMRIRRRPLWSMLNTREAIPVSEQINSCSTLIALDPRDAERLWCYFAEFFQVPPEKLRPEDDLLGNLKVLQSDYRRDIWISSGIAFSKNDNARRSLDALISLGHVSIAELICIFSEYEKTSQTSLAV